MATTKEWLQEAVLHPAWCWYLKLVDGTTMGFTSHDENITFNFLVYEAATGFVPSAVETTNSMTVDNLEVQGFLCSDRITSADLLSGRFDMAEIWVFILDWTDISKPPLIVRRGMLGEIKHSKQSFTADLRGLLDVYQAKAGKVYQKICRAHFGDSKCMADTTAYTATGTITGRYTDGNLETTLAQATTFFNYGILTFTSGQNNGLKIEVKYYTLTAQGGIIQPFLPPVWSPNVGDTFTVTAGCDGNFTTCQARGNYINFRAEPYVPGNDYMSSYPSKGSGNTNSSSNLTKADAASVSTPNGVYLEYTLDYSTGEAIATYTGRKGAVVKITLMEAYFNYSDTFVYKLWVPGGVTSGATENAGVATTEADATWAAWSRTESEWYCDRIIIFDIVEDQTVDIYCKVSRVVGTTNYSDQSNTLITSVTYHEFASGDDGSGTFGGN